jgi:pimeloyl-ACP methyl ester carboxylesterase
VFELEKGTCPALKDSKMYSKTYGHGNKTLILINGGPSLSNYMSTLGVQLSDKYKIVEYNQKGAPENPTTNKDALKLKGHLSDLRDVVESYCGSQIVLIGHSWGASLALLFMAENPGIVTKTILIGSAPLNDEASKKFGENIQLRLDDESKLKLQTIKLNFDQAKSDEERNLFMQKRLTIIGPAYHLDPKTEKNLSNLKWDYTTFVTSIDSLRDFIDDGKIPQTLAAISDPVVTFHGEFDPIPMNETFEFLNKHIKGLKTVEVHKSGHFPWLEKDSKETFLRDLLIELET